MRPFLSIVRLYIYRHLTNYNFQMKLFNRHFPAAERVEYMGWVHEGVVGAGAGWQTYRARFLVLKGTDVMLFEQPPVSEGWRDGRAAMFSFALPISSS